MHLGVPGGEHHFKILDGIIPHLDVVGDGILKQDNVLIHHRQRAGHHASWNLLARLPVKQDLALPGIIEAGDQLGQRGFAAARGAHKGHSAARLQGHGKVLDQWRRQLGITEGDVF